MKPDEFLSPFVTYHLIFTTENPQKPGIWSGTTLHNAWQQVGKTPLSNKMLQYKNSAKQHQWLNTATTMYSETH